MYYGDANAMAEENTVGPESNSYERDVIGAAKRLCEVYGDDAYQWKYQTHWSSGSTQWQNTSTGKFIIVERSGDIKE